MTACSCGREVDTKRGGAGGKCARCYMAARRRAAGMVPRAQPIAPAGEGDEVTFRIPRQDKEAMAALARTFGLDSPSELYRRAVRLLLQRPSLARKS